MNAVKSILDQKKVSEIIIVDDGSNDASFAICRELAENNSEFRLLQHPNGENRGVSASRNLGIVQATSKYVSFLDADDIYLNGRFDMEPELFSDDTIDGVYHASVLSDGRHYSITEPVDPANLFYYLLTGEKGYFNTNSITVKKSALIEAGMFNEQLKLHEDTELWLKLAKKFKIIAGVLDRPLSLVTVHGNNTIKQRDQKSLLKFYQSVFLQFPPETLSKNEKKPC